MRCRVKPLSTLSLAKRKAASATIPFVSSCLKSFIHPRSCQVTPTAWTGSANPCLPELPAHSTLASTYRVLSDWSPSAVAIAMRQCVETIALRFALVCFHIFFVVKLHRRVDEGLMFSPFLLLISIYVPGVGLKAGPLSKPHAAAS